MEKDKCFICSSTTNNFYSQGLKYTIGCPRCGNYTITRLATNYFESSQFTSQQIANISGWLRENHMEICEAKDIDYLSNLQTPSVAQKAEKLILYLSKKYPMPGQRFVIGSNNQILMSVSWTQNIKELIYLMQSYLSNCKNFLKVYDIDKSDSSYLITPEGWAYIESLKFINIESQIGFIAMWFDKQLDSLWKDTIEKAIEDAGYEPKRIDQHEHINKIDDEIIAMIKRSKFIIADFTGQRGGVYFEAGYAMGLGLPVFWICKKDEIDVIHFDTRQFNFILWEKSKLEEARKALKNRIERVIGKGEYIKNKIA